MQREQIPPFAAFLPKPEDGRRHGRIQCHATGCTLGEVLDLSGGGMRVNCEQNPRLNPGDEFRLSLHGGDEPFPVHVRVAWYKKRAHRRHQLGLQFVQVDEVTRRRLSMLAREITRNQMVHRGALPRDQFRAA